MKCFDNGAAEAERAVPTEAGIPRVAWMIVAGAVPLHLALALATDLSPDEAYYLAAARLERPIVDHPPLLMWLLRLGDGWMAGPVELRVRIWAVLFSLGTGLGCVALAKQRGAGPRGCVLAAWIGGWALLPTAGGFVTTPDGPFLLAVVLALLVVGADPGSGTDPRSGTDPGSRTDPRWAAAGALPLLMGALAKVTALPVAALLAAGLRAPVMVRVALAAVPLAALPWLWPSLRFQLHHAFAQKAPAGWSPLAAIGAVLGAAAAQALLWSPQVILRGGRALPQLPGPDRALVLGLTTLLVASALLRGVPPEPNWWAPAAIVVLAGFARTAVNLSTAAQRGVLAAVLIPTVVAAVHTVRPFLPLSPQADPTARLHGWSRGAGPADAPGVGVYGPPAERCVYLGECKEISSYFDRMRLHE